MHPDYRRRLARIFCEGLIATNQISGVVRLHPSEKLDFYAPEIAEFPSIRFMANGGWTLDEALAAADVVVCHNSGLGNDALIKGKLVVVVELAPLPLGNGQELVERAGCPIALSKDELSGLLIRIFSDRFFRKELMDCAEKYVSDFCVAFGEDAVKNIYDIATSIQMHKN
jgi:glycosyltransferase involved in cell wall biosynthesis